MAFSARSLGAAAILAVLLVALSSANAQESNVLTLTEKNFQEAIEEHKFMVVEFYAPWCGHCKQLAPEYEKAATMLKGNMDAGVPITLGQVDATVERGLGEKYQVQGYPTLKIFSNGKEPVDYEGPRDADGIVSYLIKRAGPASTHLEDANKALAIKEKEPVMVVLAGKVTDEWTQVADSMRDAVAWAHTTDKAVKSKLGIKDGITLLKHFDEGSVVYTGSATNKEEIMAFVKLQRVQVAMPIKKGDQAALKIVFEDESMPNAFLFTEGIEKEMAAFKDGSMASRGSFVTGYFTSTDFPEAFAHFGVDKYIQSKELPKVMIEDRKEGLRYVMSGEVTKGNVEKFLADFKEGKLEPFLKSEEPPASNDGPVKVIVGSTFDAEVANGGKWVLLEAYAPWCGHCKKLMPVWEDLGEAFKESSGTVTIAKVDATANDLPKSLGIKGFPTLLLFKGDGTPPMDYSGERDYAALASFITKKTGAKPTAGFKPKSGSSSSSGESLDKTIIRFFASEFQVPWMSAGYKVSGLYLAAICVFLLFVAAIALVIACMSKEPAAAPAKGKKD